MATLTAYSTSGDGIVRGGSNTSWAVARAEATGSDAFAAQTSSYLPGYADNNAGSTYTYFIARGYCAFDISSIPAGATIQSAVLSFYGTGAGYTGGGGTTANNSACIVAGTQASTTALATSDFSLVGSTELASRVAYSSFQSAGYKDFTLNSSGLAHLTSAIGSTVKFAVRPGYDLDNVAPTNTGYSGGVAYFSEQTGTSNDPKLVVTYTTDKLTSDTWAWSDVAAPYRRSTVEVEVWAAGPNTLLNGAHSPVGATITVDSTADFASSGTVWVIDGYTQAYATYTGKTATTFTGCSWTSVDGDLNFPDNSGVGAPNAETHFPDIIPLDNTSTPPLLITAGQHAGHAARYGSGVGKISYDGGMTWGAQFTIGTATTAADWFGARAGSVRMKNGRLIATWYEHDLDYITPGSTMIYYSYLSYSDDNGTSWSTPALMNLNMGYSNRDGAPSGITAGMLYTGAGSNATYGDYYFMVQGNPDGIQVHASGQTYRSEVWLYKVTDGGAGGTATKVAEVFKYADVGLGSGEGDLCIAANGNWIAHARIEPDSTAYDAEDRDRWQSVSTDAGVTWSTPTMVIHGLANGACINKLPDGTLVATGSPVLAGDAPNAGQTGSVLSYNNGVTWNRTIKWEATNATYNVYNGANVMPVIDDPLVQVNSVMAYAQENATQTGARTMFRWYVNPSARYVTDTWAWSDTATHAGVTKPRTTSDSWAWSDSAVVPVNASRTASDTWAWADAATRTAAFTRLTVEHPTSGANSEYWAWSDVAIPNATSTYARTASDTWAWSDTASQSTSGPAARTASDTWAWSDALARTLAASRTTSDRWLWSEPAPDPTAPLFWLMARARRRTMSAPTKTYKVVLPSGTTKTATWTSETYVAQTEAGILVVLDVTAASGSGGLTLRINAHDQASSQAVPLNSAPTAVTATGTTSYALYPFGAVAGNVTQATEFYLPRMFSISVTHGDSSSYTYSVGYCLLP